MLDPRRPPPRPWRVLVFDSGLGGLTVFAPLATMRPDLLLTYLADDAAFPYGRMTDEALMSRVEAVIGAALQAYSPDLVVVACNTASTLALPRLRKSHAQLPFVGTVPAIKPAAAASRSKRVSVLATPATVARDYTRRLIADHAAGCEVTLVGAARLAGEAERHCRGDAIDEALVAAEIAPAFVDAEDRRTDTIVLACTHFPLLLEALRACAPWRVAFVDPGEAIARRVDSLLPSRPGARPPPPTFAHTSSRPLEPALRRKLAASGFAGAAARLRLGGAID